MEFEGIWPWSNENGIAWIWLKIGTPAIPGRTLKYNRTLIMVIFLLNCWCLSGKNCMCNEIFSKYSKLSWSGSF
jgi:hypothetical protein